ncbi:hypothetical protein NP493_547g01002 [Ridgeia piscesae]|uniref:Elongation factor-like 1 n=1 Tax=Ridgeia piscesae TaxID=27915 RepID=A0AAD9NRS2_RIDPI|nr:hypothetical protein NP493_547g01002 [Ridgeia piscesae]
MDRLITELKLTPLEAYHHLVRLLEKVNAVMGELFGAEVMEKSSQVNGSGSAMEDSDDSSLYFSPDQDNVVFASAVDGWGFRIKEFAELYAAKLKLKSDVLHKTLWGDFYLENKTKHIKKGAQNKGKKPLFVQFVLENVWAVYESVLVNKDKEKTDKIIKSLNLRILPRDSRSTDSRVHLHAICHQWLPLAHSLLEMVVEKLPSAMDITPDRVHKLLYSAVMDHDTLPPQTQRIRKAFLDCSSTDDAPLIVYVSKMLSVDRKALPRNRHQALTTEELAKRGKLARERHAERMRQAEGEVAGKKTGCSDDTVSSDAASNTLTDGQSTSNEAVASEDTKELEPEEVFIAFARVFSGTVRRGQEMLVLGPKHNPLIALEQVEGTDQVADLTTGQLAGLRYVSRATVTDVYMLMGRELESLPEVPAGNILGLGGLSEHIINSATVSSTLACPAFTEMFFEATPILRVAVEPKHTGDMSALMAGLRLLNQADACVQVLVQQTGEHVIVAAGEIHLQKCLEDLTTRFAKVEVNVSAPIVPFRETIILPPTTDIVNEAIQDQPQPSKPNNWENQATPTDDDTHVIDIDIGGGACRLKIRAIPLPEDAAKLLEESSDMLKILSQFSGRNTDRHSGHLTTHMSDRVSDFKERLVAVFARSEDWAAEDVDKIWAFGPRQVGPNILLNRAAGNEWLSLWDTVGRNGDDVSKLESWDVRQGIVSGFQLATDAGPLCEEPMRGVCFVIEHIELAQSDDTLSVGSTDRVSDADGVDLMTRSSMPAYTGQLMSSVKDGCRRAFQAKPQRMVAAMYSCVIQATADVLGKVYASLGKRNGRVLKEDLLEGWSLFNITAVLPMAESFGFVKEIRKRTSGLASPQLRFSHWEVIDMDPFWVPTTEEEYLHFGEKADSENIACRYMNDVRRRKGLKVDEKIVEFGEKQRTLSKNK